LSNLLPQKQTDMICL